MKVNYHPGQLVRFASDVGLFDENDDVISNVMPGEMGLVIANRESQIVKSIGTFDDVFVLVGFQLGWVYSQWIVEL